MSSPQTQRSKEPVRRILCQQTVPAGTLVRQLTCTPGNTTSCYATDASQLKTASGFNPLTETVNHRGTFTISILSGALEPDVVRAVSLEWPNFFIGENEGVNADEVLSVNSYYANGWSTSAMARDTPTGKTRPDCLEIRPSHGRNHDHRLRRSVHSRVAQSDGGRHEVLVDRLSRVQRNNATVSIAFFNGARQYPDFPAISHSDQSRLYGRAISSVFQISAD